MKNRHERSRGLLRWRPRIAAAVPNTPENLWRWLENPQRTKPGTLMPRTPLTAQELDDLVAYLESLK